MLEFVGVLGARKYKEVGKNYEVRAIFTILSAVMISCVSKEIAMFNYRWLTVSQSYPDKAGKPCFVSCLTWEKSQ